MSFYILRKEIKRTFKNRFLQYGSHTAVPEDEEHKLRGGDLDHIHQVTMAMQGGIDADDEGPVSRLNPGRSTFNNFGAADRRTSSYAPASQEQAEDDYHRLKARTLQRMNMLKPMKPRDSLQDTRRRSSIGTATRRQSMGAHVEIDTDSTGALEIFSDICPRISINYLPAALAPDGASRKLSTISSASSVDVERIPSDSSHGTFQLTHGEQVEIDGHTHAHAHDSAHDPHVKPNDRIRLVNPDPATIPQYTGLIYAEC